MVALLRKISSLVQDGEQVLIEYIAGGNKLKMRVLLGAERRILISEAVRLLLLPVVVSITAPIDTATTATEPSIGTELTNLPTPPDVTSPVKVDISEDEVDDILSKELKRVL